MRTSRALRSPLAAVATCLLLAATAACGPPENTAGPAATVEEAVDRVTAQESATVTVRLDAPTDAVHELLRAFDEDSTEADAERLARAEAAFALEADRPLNQLDRYGPGTRLALALSFGDRDVVGYKSVGERAFLRLQLGELARLGRLAPEQRKRVEAALRLRDGLPQSLGPVRKLLGGDWVRFDPDAFADYDWAVREFTGLSVDGNDFRDANSVLDGAELRRTLHRLEQVLIEHSSPGTPRQGAGDVQRIPVELPGRRTAGALVPLLGPLGADIDPREVPDRPVAAELTVRRGSLAEMRMDLGQLVDGGSARVPLRMRFAPGDVFSTQPPGDAPELSPQDLLAAALYGVTRQDS